MIRLETFSIFRSFVGISFKTVQQVSSELNLDKVFVSKEIKRIQLRLGSEVRRGFRPAYTVRKISRRGKTWYGIMVYEPTQIFFCDVCDFYSQLEPQFGLESPTIPIPNLVDFPENLQYLLDQVDPNYTFGVEFEFAHSASASKIIAAFRSQGLPVKDESRHYGRSSAYEWVLCYDASAGFELTTPALKGVAGMKEMYRYCQVLRTLEQLGDISITKSCGTHIHLGTFGDLQTRRKIAERFFKQYALNEKHIDKVICKSRRASENHYCASICRASDLSIKKQKVTLRKIDIVGTLEIRHHGGTLDFTKIANWIVFNQLVLKKCESAPVERKSNFESYFGEVTHINSELFNYFTARKERLA